MAREIITQYSGIFSQPPEDSNGDPDNIRIVLVKNDGSQEELFRGSKFSEEKLAEELKKRNRTSKLYPLPFFKFIINIINLKKGISVKNRHLGGFLIK